MCGTSVKTRRGVLLGLPVVSVSETSGYRQARLLGLLALPVRA